MRELRCSNAECGMKNGVTRTPRLLGKALMAPGSVLEIKCPRCGIVTEFRTIDTAAFEEADTTH